MNGAGRRYEIFTLAKRIQHGVFFMGFAASYLTGIALPGGRGFLLRPVAALFGGPDTLSWWHAFFGQATAAVLGVHILYLAVRAYIEDLSIGAFPFRFGPADGRRLLADAALVLRAQTPATIRYTPFRKLSYWCFLGGGLALMLSGSLIRYWDRFDSPLVTTRLGSLAAAHGGLSLLMAVLILWHVYAVLDGGRRPAVLILAVTGRISEEDLEAYYPDEYLRIKEEERRLAEEILKADQKKLMEKELLDERQTIESMLQRGNRLAGEKKYLEAADEYREALLRFPAYSQAQYNLALVLEKAGRPAEALEAYRRFVEIDPFHPLEEKARQAINRIEKQT